MRCEELVVRRARRDVVVRVVRRVESVCCAFTVDTPPKVRAIARPIAQLLENPIRIFPSDCAALRIRPRGRPCGRSTGLPADHRSDLERRHSPPASRGIALTLPATDCIVRPPQVEAID